MKKYEIENHEPSLLPDGYDFELVWSDEFDGEAVDTEKWDYRRCIMGKKHPGWSDKAVKLVNGCAVFGIFEENGEVVSSQLQTGYNFMDEPVQQTKFMDEYLQWPIGKLRENKFTKRYGYFECRCRLQKMPGWWSAFWIQSPIIGASLDPKLTGSEVDIMESSRPGRVHRHNVFTNGYGQDMRRFSAGGKDMDTEEFHTFGVLWSPDKYVFYVDGVEDGVVEDAVSGVPAFILLTTEPFGYRQESHRPTEAAKAAAAAGDNFLVDYVRVFDIKEN
jgi:beta-glucanase (GH16 family)